MWEYEAFIGKAELYFTRADQYPAAEDDVLALWLLLGLEFLLRAPLAKVHPSLLADPSGDSIMHAVGLPISPDGSQPKSIPTKTVLIRLTSIVPNFDKERQEDATFLASLRNSELHSSDASLDIDVSKWLPHFTRVVEVICTHLSIDSSTLVGRQIIQQGRALVDKADKRLEHEIKERIAASRVFFEHLKPEEIEARRGLVIEPKSRYASGSIIARQVMAAARGITRNTPFQRIECPSCKEKIAMRLDSVRSTNERLENDEIVHDIVYIAVNLACPVCDLELKTTAEIRAAGIEQQYVRTQRESIEDRFMKEYEGEDYGND